MKKLFILFGILFLLPFLCYRWLPGGGAILYAQLPTCSGRGLGIIYFDSLTSSANPFPIYKYDPFLPFSSSNPIAVSISKPAGSQGLALCNNVNAASPSPTFYTVKGGNFYYYDGTSWVNTGHSAGVNYGNIGGGGGFIYNVISPNVYKYTGTGNATLLTSVPPGFISDVAVDCKGNFYLLNLYTNPAWLREYDTAGNQIASWTISGATTGINSGGGLAITGRHVYYNNSSGFWHGVMTGTNVSFNLVTSSVYNPALSDFANCPSSNSPFANMDTLYRCGSGIPDTLIGFGDSGTLSWSVIGGPATISGSGDTVTVTSTGNAKLLLTTSATPICGGNTDTVELRYIPPPTGSSNSPVCAGDSVLLYATDTATITDWQWTGPNSFTDSVQNTFRTSAVLVDSGDYVVKILTTTCSISDTVHVSIKPIPAKPQGNSNSPICANNTLQLNATDSTSGVGWQWTGPNSFSSTSQNPTRTNVPLADSGKYIVKARLNGCNSKPDTIDVVIDAVIIPSANISSVPLSLIPGHNDTFTAHVTNCTSPTYQWYLNGNKINGATGNPYVTTLAAGQHISVVVHCSGLCEMPDSVKSDSLATVGVTSPCLSFGEVMVWPNPFDLTLSLSIHGVGTTPVFPAEVKIFNIVGQMVYSSIISEDKALISTREFSTGTYILELTLPDGNREVRKMMK